MAPKVELNVSSPALAILGKEESVRYNIEKNTKFAEIRNEKDRHGEGAWSMTLSTDVSSGSGQAYQCDQYIFRGETPLLKRTFLSSQSIPKPTFTEDFPNQDEVNKVKSLVASLAIRDKIEKILASNPERKYAHLSLSKAPNGVSDKFINIYRFDSLSPEAKLNPPPSFSITITHDKSENTIGGKSITVRTQDVLLVNPGGTVSAAYTETYDPRKQSYSPREFRTPKLTGNDKQLQLIVENWPQAK